MPKPKRHLHATVEDTLLPPTVLPQGQIIARIVKATGSNLYAAEQSNGEELLVELQAKFRSTIWIKRGSYVLVDTEALADRENKLDGEIVNVVRNEKAWRRMPYWPKEFAKKSSYTEDSDDEESTVGKLPPTDPDED